MQTLFEKRVNQYIAEESGCVLLFFKGFGLKQVRWISQHPRHILGQTKIFHNDSLDLFSLNENWMAMAMTIQSSAVPLVGFYEEYLALREFLPRLPVKKVRIIENTILSPWSPSLLQKTEALTLFDNLQGDHGVEDPRQKLFMQYYGNVRILNSGNILLWPVQPDPADAEKFWPEAYDSGTPETEISPEAIRVEFGSDADWEYRLGLTEDCQQPIVFEEPINALLKNKHSLAGALRELCIPFSFVSEPAQDTKNFYSEQQFIPILKKYWGDKASFRALKFYKDPDRSKEIETISQGQIIAEIVDQCELAKDEEPFSNIFITAPTGSGKSILFQIPALYLAEHYDLVTIVVSPLIALMNDQVDQLQNERGVKIAACINSGMSIEDRAEVMRMIHNGQKSLLYLAPELLLTTNLETFLGKRAVGLIVIDEAHTVTSWGRDFRSDYWYLGDFLQKVKRNGLRFPVLCLTATAVYSGEDDVVNDTIHELGLEKTIIHLGNVRRENIAFDIVRHDRDQLTRKADDVKTDLTLTYMRNCIAKGEKVLAYFPYRSQVNQAHDKLSPGEKTVIRRYHGQLPTPERKMVERSYKNGEAMGLCCTKAFGMGIDVGDIKHVVHFAPTGTLADYVQEIGRAARDPRIQGLAHIDYFPSDLRYVRTLNGISEMRQYQLREMLKKIVALYQTKKQRNLLISPETFEYLFKEDEVENRTKSGLMLLAKDLDNKYTFPVLVVRPKAMLSKNYVNVPTEIENQWLKKYGAYAELQDGENKYIVSNTNFARGSDIAVSSFGNTYRVDMAAVWEAFYPDQAFGMFKKYFFEEQFQGEHGLEHIFPRVKTEIQYADSHKVVAAQVELVLNAMVAIFGTHKNSDSRKQFTLSEFEAELEDALGEKVVPHDKIGILLDIFSENVDANAAYTTARSRTRVLRKRKQGGSDETMYFVSNPAYASLNGFFVHLLYQCIPNVGKNTFSRFYPLTQNKSIEIMPLLRLLEILGLANYEIRGGEKAEVFIRINDPDKLVRLSNTRYTNSVLQMIQKKHRTNERLLSAFFMADLSTEERWELIEQYFLGNREYVQQQLGIAE